MSVNTSTPVSGEITSGVFPNRSDVTAPDSEQTRRLQARQESDWASGDRADHPEYTRSGPTTEDELTAPDSNRSREEAQTAGESS